MNPRIQRKIQNKQGMPKQCVQVFSIFYIKINENKILSFFFVLYKKTLDIISFLHDETRRRRWIIEIGFDESVNGFSL